MSIYGNPVTLGPRWITAKKVSILPFQAGVGDPSPSNHRPISGYDACDIWVSPTPDPADGTTYQTIFGNPPGTVYGGEFDLETGGLTVDRATVILNATTGVTVGTTSAGLQYAQVLYSAVGVTGIEGSLGVISSDYTWMVSTDTSVNGSIKTYASNFRVYDQRFTSVADAKSILATVQVVYFLATPVTYQLTPQQISFLGNQYFGANCGPVLIKVGK